MKPKLPISIEYRFPVEIVYIIYTFVPHFPPPKQSPDSMQKELTRIQNTKLHGKRETYMMHLEDFLLD
jgi:hypothetical protein